MPWRPIHAFQREVDEFVAQFRQKAVFYLDEPVAPAVAETLKAMGFRVRTAADCRVVGRDDADHAALCWREGMILVTHDHDFLTNQLVPEHHNPGVRGARRRSVCCGQGRLLCGSRRGAIWAKLAGLQVRLYSRWARCDVDKESWDWSDRADPLPLASESRRGDMGERLGPMRKECEESCLVNMPGP
jgi:hypothetical protein